MTQFVYFSKNLYQVVPHNIIYILKNHFIGLRVTFIMGIRVTVIMGVPCVQSSYCCLVWFVNIGVKFMRKAISDLDEFPKPLKSKVRILIGLIHHKDATATSRVMIILQLFIGEPPPPHTHTHTHTLSRSPLLWG